VIPSAQFDRLTNPSCSSQTWLAKPMDSGRETIQANLSIGVATTSSFYSMPQGNKPNQSHQARSGSV
jgi:hypothetical protein